MKSEPQHSLRKNIGLSPDLGKPGKVGSQTISPVTRPVDRPGRSAKTPNVVEAGLARHSSI